MDKVELNELLRRVAAEEVSPETAALELKMKPIQEAGEYAKVDMHRGIRQGVPEVIYGAGKAKEHILGIAKTMLQNGQKTVLITRIDRETAEFLRDGLPEETTLDFNESAKTCVVGNCRNQTAQERLLWQPAAPATFPLPRKPPLQPKCWATRWSGSMMWAFRASTDCSHTWTRL